MENKWITLNIHGFSTNSLHDYDRKTGKRHRSNAYNKWRNRIFNLMEEMPTLEELGVDPNKPMRITAIFTQVRGYDTDNMMKSFQDALATYYDFDDNNIVEPNSKRDSTGFVRTLEEGTITFCIENCEGLIMNEFDKLLMAIDKGWIKF